MADLTMDKLVALCVVLVTDGTQLCTQIGLVGVQIFAQSIEVFVIIPEFEVHHAQQHDGIGGKSHAFISFKATKKAGHSTK